MSQSANWETSDVSLDSSDVAEALTKKLYNIEFENANGNPVYAVEVERIDINKVAVVMSDGTEFTLTCDEGV
jgi:hypothetical protein